MIYPSFIFPTLEYTTCNVVWYYGYYDSDILKLEKFHIDGMRLVTGWGPQLGAVLRTYTQKQKERNILYYYGKEMAL